jgi:hypothetical protein
MMLLPGIFIYQAKASRNPTKANSMKMGEIRCRRLMKETDEETDASDEEQCQKRIDDKDASGITLKPMEI